MDFSGSKILCWLQYTVKWCHFVFHCTCKLIIQMFVNEGYSKGYVCYHHTLWRIQWRLCLLLSYVMKDTMKVMFAIIIRYEGYSKGYVCYHHTLWRIQWRLCLLLSYVMKDTMKVMFAIVIRCSKPRLWVDYFIYFEFTRVFFYSIFLIYVL